jgi:AcrR family transcriptional regulator
MDRIAEALEYSKGTIYQHFSCKEEIVLSLANKALEKRCELFRRGAAFRGKTRERMHAIGMGAEIFLGLYPHYFHLEQLVRLPSLWEKTSENRRAFMQVGEAQCKGIVGGVARDAVACGDLALPPGATPEMVVFGLWSISFGANIIIQSGTSLDDLGLADPMEALRMSQMMLLDGYGWRPLTADYPYAEADERLRKEVFAEEFRLMKKA